MVVHVSMLLFACMASSTSSLKHQGITVARELKATVGPDESPSSFNLADISRGGSASQGWGARTNILRKIGSGASIWEGWCDDLQEASEVSHASASMDPHPQQELSSHTAQSKMQSLIQSPELLMKAVQENPVIKQLEGNSPVMAEIIHSPGALQNISSPQMIQQMQYGHPRDVSMQQILAIANVSGAGNASLPEGLKLKQVRPGDGKTFPQNGEEVVMQYKGYLRDGSVFGSGEFSLHIGSSGAIHGWDFGVRRMSLGERAVLQVPACLGYAHDGAGSIPPNADLVFEMSLQEIKPF